MPCDSQGAQLQYTTAIIPHRVTIYFFVVWGVEMIGVEHYNLRKLNKVIKLEWHFLFHFHDTKEK